MATIAAIAAGGSLGALARYGIDVGIEPATPTRSFPGARSSIEPAAGCLLVGVLSRHARRPSARQHAAVDPARPVVGLRCRVRARPSPAIARQEDARTRRGTRCRRLAVLNGAGSIAFGVVAFRGRARWADALGKFGEMPPHAALTARPRCVKAPVSGSQAQTAPALCCAPRARPRPRLPPARRFLGRDGLVEALVPGIGWRQHPDMTRLPELVRSVDGVVSGRAATSAAFPPAAGSSSTSAAGGRLRLFRFGVVLVLFLLHLRALVRAPAPARLSSVSRGGAPMIVIASEGSCASSNAAQPSDSSVSSTRWASTTGCGEAAGAGRANVYCSRPASHSIRQTIANAPAMASRIAHHESFATPSATATAMRKKTSPAMRHTAGGMPSRAPRAP